ncbi:hypothetical protein BJ508DRAFT_412672 [Ascobolus immersus RN42]|uniref:Uncharacterized protein n=1 Tax=Ascobolus immersus RN42 TaxID=1160509 RepID=A0A3N4IG75_ASCIM|nr:hypothetical protein BJ508DRAFT_412672 [Ascobolus immersus RN42]
MTVDLNPLTIPRNQLRSTHLPYTQIQQTQGYSISTMSTYPRNPLLIPIGPSLPPKQQYTAHILDPTILTGIQTGQIHHPCLAGSIDFLLATNNYTFPSTADFQLAMQVPFHSGPRQASTLLRAISRINHGKTGNPMPARHVGSRPALTQGTVEWKVGFEHGWDFLPDVGQGWKIEVSYVKVELVGGREVMTKVKEVGRLFVPGKYNPEPVECRKVYSNGMAGRDTECVGIEVVWALDNRGG